MFESYMVLIFNFMIKIFCVVFYNGDLLYFDFFLYIVGDIYKIYCELKCSLFI